MNRYINAMLAVSMLLLMSCGGRLEKNVEQDYTGPSLKYQPRVMYPRIAQAESTTGNSKVILLIGKDGKVENVDILESTGSGILDSAAVSYCKKLLFSPAQRNGEDVSSRMEWGIQFAIVDQNWDPYIYVRDVLDLYRMYDRAQPSNQLEIEDEILAKHNNFIENMRDALNFNVFVDAVISTQLANQWKEDWDSWPLSFLIYQDFLQRFKDYKNLAYVKTLLANALRYDVQFIENTNVTTTKEKMSKEKILRKIKEFVAEKYPDIKVNIIDTVSQNGFSRMY